MNFEVIINNWRYILFGTYPDGPIEGVLLTFLISLLAGSISIILGIIIGVLLTTLKSLWVNVLVVFLCFFRSIPIILLMFWSYFLLPILLGTDIPELITVISVLSLINAAYLGHVVKTGISAITKEQWQAGMSLGFTMFGVLWNIILPQVLIMIVPSFINQLIALIKDTSLAYIVGVAELSFLATRVNSREMIYSMEIFLFVAAIYFVICFSLEIIANCMLSNFKKNTSRMI
ncbi:MAG: amino acid ABC transporter permease [Arsenophonus sp.]|nr:MAG: amino acid ABC transporter permease [Arsenophonus sp.]